MSVHDQPDPPWLEPGSGQPESDASWWVRHGWIVVGLLTLAAVVALVVAIAPGLTDAATS